MDKAIDVRFLLVFGASWLGACGGGQARDTGDAATSTDAASSADADAGTREVRDCPSTTYTRGAGTLPVSPMASTSYGVMVSPANIAMTEATEASVLPKVYVKPRTATAHPETLWDQKDISAILGAVSAAKNSALVANFNALKSQADKRITLTSTTETFDVYGATYTLPGTSFTPEGVPIPKLVGGVAQYLGDPTDVSGANASSIQILGIVYALTGDATYGEFARQMLLSYANYYGQYAHPTGWTLTSYRSALDGRLSYQFLNDAFILAELAWGYDLIFNLSSFTDADRTSLRVNLFDAITAEFSNPVEIVGGADYLSFANNRSAISAAATLMAGYACDDMTLVNDALYGTGGTAGHPMTGGGLTEVHWGSSILADGLWVESSLGYQTSIAAAGVFDAAIIMEKHGMDVFGQYRLKSLLDSAIDIAYPDPPLLLPNLGNTGPTALLNSAGWASNEIGMPYEYGYLYYQDPAYLPLIRNASQSLAMTVHAGAPSLFLDTPAGAGVVTEASFSGVSGTASASTIFAWLLANGFFRETMGTQGDPIALTPTMTAALASNFKGQAPAILAVLKKALGSVPTPTVQNDNFYVNGYGVLRLPGPGGAAAGINQLLVEYGSNIKSHGEPDDMSLDLFALGGQLLDLPGDVFPYDLAIDPAWYWTTLASNSLVVDQVSQVGGGTYDSRTQKAPYVDQVVYGFSSTMGVQKVSSNTLYPGVRADAGVMGEGGVNEDRAVFMTENYVADVFAAFSSTSHLYDLPWHTTGTLTTSLSLAPRTVTDFTNPGYESLTHVLHASTDDAWNATFTLPNGNAATFWAAKNPRAEVITADGDLYLYGTSAEVTPPLILERQSNVHNALFGSVLDISGGPYVTGVVEEGISSGEGYAMLLRVEHGKSADYAFTSYSPGHFKSADGTFETDAWQALVVLDGQGLRGLFLGGGTTLSTPFGSLKRADSTSFPKAGLAYVERDAAGEWVVGNGSPSDATLTVSLPCAGIDTSLVAKASSTQNVK